jgi:hypothetical protein
MIGIAIANSIGLSSAAAGPDPAAQAFIDAAGITGDVQQQAINNLVKGLKADGIWSKMKAVYPFVTDNRNLLSYTEDFSNSFWGKQDSTVVSNSTTAPNGTLTADTLIDNTVNSYHGIIMTDNINATSGITYTSTIYAKYNGRNIQLTYDTGQFGAAQYANFDLQNGVLGSVLGGTATITSAENGWYRCSFSRAATSTGPGNRIYTLLINSLSATRAQSFIGDAVSGAFIWGIQLEQSVTPSTYQPIATTQQAYIASQFKYNLVNPVDSDAAFRLVFNGGWTHSSTGATPNGTNGYADSKFVPSSNLTINNQSYSVYSRSNTAAGFKRELSVSNSGEIGVLVRYAADLFYPIIGAGTYPTLANTDSRGYYIANRTDGTNIKGYKNGSLVINSAQTANLPTSQPVYLSSKNNGGTAVEFSDRQLAISTIGEGLTDTEASNLYTRVQAYQTALSRQV